MATSASSRGTPGAGRIVAGAIGDLALFDENLHVVATFIGGEMAYRRP